jgi:hypothetical protein
MKTNREKTTGVMGFVVSVLLHGIFFAGCIALDYTNNSATDNVDGTEIQKITDEEVAAKTKS